MLGDSHTLQPSDLFLLVALQSLLGTWYVVLHSGQTKSHTAVAGFDRPTALKFVLHVYTKEWYNNVHEYNYCKTRA